MPNIHTLSLPSILPHPDAIKSWKQTKTDYESDCWEFQYEIHRYLGRITDDELRTRHDNIVRNMHAIISNDRHVIPIHSFLSSWYWYRKEHQTRYEFALRNLQLHRPVPAIVQRNLDAAPARPRSPNAGDFLFRYGDKKWLRQLVDFGRLRMRSAQEYALMEKDPARQDDERVKRSHSPGEYVTITLPDGQRVRPIGDLTYETSGTDYFLYCVSLDWDAGLFDEFPNTDCCVVIKQPDEFARRLEKAGKALLPDWYFHNCPIEYFDTHERRPKERIDNAMSKDFRFAYQKEYRFLFAGFGRPATGFVDIELGSLRDIAELYTRP